MKHTLFREFLKRYEVITDKGVCVNPDMMVLSLFEDMSEQRPPSVVERVVEEQMRLMREGEGKDDAMTAAVNQISATDDSITIRPLASSLSCIKFSFTGHSYLVILLTV